MHRPQLRSGNLCYPSLTVECLPRLFGIFLRGRCVSSLSFVNLITSFYHYGPVDIYFIL